jgi:hypothetical protein
MRVAMGIHLILVRPTFRSERLFELCVAGGLVGDPEWDALTLTPRNPRPARASKEFDALVWILGQRC